jgi:hypothetical protein
MVRIAMQRLDSIDDHSELHCNWTRLHDSAIVFGAIAVAVELSLHL